MLPKSKFTIKFIILIVIFLFFINFFSISGKIQNFFYSVSLPMQKSLWGAGINLLDFSNNVFNVKNIKQENRDLKLRLNELEVKNIQLFQLEQENNFLRQALDINLSEDFDLILADVIGKDYFQDSIMINKGSRDGVNVGLSVITREKALVGMVEEVYDNFSKITLISNKKSSFNVEIIPYHGGIFLVFPIGEERASEPDFSKSIFCKAVGKGNFKIDLDFISKEEEIFKGDLVTTALLGDIFPKGLLVGRIKEVKDAPADPFWGVDLELGFNLEDLKHIFVIKNEL